MVRSSGSTAAKCSGGASRRDAERAADRGLPGAGDGGVDEAEPELGRRLPGPRGEGDGARRQVDDDRAGAGRREDAVVAEQHLLDLRRARERPEDDVARGGELGDVRCLRAAHDAQPDEAEPRRGRGAHAAASV